MKNIAFYLPQFHSIPENDRWWGKDFTEWVNTKKAKPFYKEHYQPRVPENFNYYNLLEESTLRWQAKLAKDNNVYGFCFYHYWFNGHKLLEKPAEILLKNSSIDINYCFSWANEPWTRAWDGKNKEILMEQKYGSEKEWKEHFDYLLPFFKDNRYIKLNGKPIYLIYRTNNIPRVNEMVDYWEQLAIKNGLKGMSVIETLNTFQTKPVVKSSIGYVYFEPMYTMRHKLNIFKQGLRQLKKYFGFLDTVEYDYLIKKISNRNDKCLDKKVFYSAFVDWDNSPRKGKKALIVKHSTPEKFGNLISKLSNLSKEEFLFINAWNEWAEGTYLEPDQKNSDSYLKEIKNFEE